jgi:myo-inositol-1(or 4)-monophosphatase
MATRPWPDLFASLEATRRGENSTVQPTNRRLLEVAVEAAQEAAPILLAFFRQDSLEVQYKSTFDLVSEADHQSEAKLVSVIRQHFPDHRILAEEGSGALTGGETLADAGYEWLVDPLDGTSNFLQGLPYFAISVACRRGEDILAAVVLDPVGENLFTASRGGGARWNQRPMSISERPGLAGSFLATGYPWKARAAFDLYLRIFRDVFLSARGVRRCGAAALDLAYTAAGVYDGFFEFRLAPWDIGAGILLVQEAGGQVSDLDGQAAYLAGGNLVAGPETLQTELLAAIREHADEGILDQLDPRPQQEVGANVS